MTKFFTPPERKLFNQLDLSMSTKQILLGSLLGDGSLKIAKGYKNARFCERHSIVQEDYLKWKFEHLHPELGGTLSFLLPEKPSFSQHSKLIYQSAVSEKLTVLHHFTHRQNKKVIQRRWLNHIEPLALAVWWCDDGSLNVVKRQGVFCTDCFSYSELLVLARYLKVDWNCECRIIENPVKNKKKETIRIDYRLRFASFSNLESFLRLILPYIPVPSMLYKGMICYEDPKYQQRWISEMQNALPQFADEIAQRYEEPFRRYAALVQKTPGLTFRDVFYKTAKFKALCPAACDL
jgi:LAGLIDADG DNA endonuclease family